MYLYGLPVIYRKLLADKVVSNCEKSHSRISQFISQYANIQACYGTLCQSLFPTPKAAYLQQVVISTTLFTISRVPNSWITSVGFFRHLFSPNIILFSFLCRYTSNFYFEETKFAIASTEVVSGSFNLKFCSWGSMVDGSY